MITARQKDEVTKTTRPTASADPAHSGERGAAVVEFAVVLVPLLLIVFGAVDFGRFYSQRLSMQYAARETARTIALKYDDETITTEVLEFLVDEQLVDLLPDVDSVAELDDTYSIQTQICSLTDPDGTAIVSLEKELEIFNPFADLAGLRTIDAYAEMPCEG